MARWLDPPPVQIPDSLKDLNLPHLVLEALVRRGFSDLSSARSFLHPDSSPSTPFPGIEKPAGIITSAIRKGERICVWGDFDVDGQTSTTLLVQTLRSLGADVRYYIPVRGRESHGVHIESLNPMIENGTRLLLTCDTGITAHTALEYAKARGLQVVVTDHHDPGEELPSVDAIANPKLLPMDHPLANLAGVGVAYKLAEALLADRKSGTSQLLDLVALGLIADVALLKDETRSLAQLGIRALRSTDRLGLKLMAEIAGIDVGTLTEETIGFTFAPRLNAIGRLGDANPVVELLLTQDPSRANLLVTQIEGLNAQRRLLTRQVYEAAETQIRLDPGLLAQPAIILSHPGWPAGVVGIVASKLVERYHKPAILLTGSEDGILRGSARSIEGLHITQAIAAQKELLLGFGGHPMAAGLALDSINLSTFRKGLGRAIEAQLGTDVPEVPALQIDAWLELAEIGLELAEGLEPLAPFGAGNPAPVLATRSVKLRSVSTVGRGREHLRLILEDDSGTTRSMMWWGGAGEELPDEGSRIDVAYSLRASTYRGQRQVSILFEEFRLKETALQTGIRIPAVEVIDLRGVTDPAQQLAEIKQKSRDLEVWAEGAEQALGKPRSELQAAEDFVIYTSPPSARDLREALRIVHPHRVYVFAQAGSPGDVDGFLNRLAGLSKFAINQRGGKATVARLAAACAQRTATIHLGLEWLRAGGKISIQGDEDLELALGNDQPDQNLQMELFKGIKGILEETAAFRAYFAKQPDPTSYLEG